MVSSAVQENCTDIEFLCTEALRSPNFNPQSLAVALACKQGLSIKSVQDLSKLLPMALICAVLGIQRLRVSTKSNRKLSFSQSDAIFGLCRVWGALMEQFRQREDLCLHWLNTAKRPLANEKPIDLMQMATGRKCVLDMLERMKTGDFS